MKPLAITGYGAVTPYGVGREAITNALASGVSAPLSRTDSPLVSEDLRDESLFDARDFDPAKVLGDKGLRNFDRMTKLMIVAGKLALEDAGLKKDGAFAGARTPEQIGIVSSTAYGSLEAMTELNLVAEKEDPRYINPARFPNTVINAAAGYVSIWEDLRAPNITVVDGNCGALDGVLTVETHLRHRRGDVFLLGGGEAISDTLVRGMRMLGIVAPRDAEFSPGSTTSAGMRLGEASAYVVVERAHDAKARSANVLCEIAGYGASFEAPSSEALVVHASASAVERAVRAALRDASIEASDVDLVLSSYSGIAKFDAAEREGLARVFGDAVAVCAPKAWTGETLGAAGAVSLAMGAAIFGGASVPSLISGALSGAPRTIVATTVGYYGNVSAAILRRP